MEGDGKRWTLRELAVIDRSIKTGRTADFTTGFLPGRSANAVKLRMCKRRAELDGRIVANASNDVHSLPPIDDSAAVEAASRDVSEACRQLLKRMIETGQHWLQGVDLIAARYAEVMRG